MRVACTATPADAGRPLKRLLLDTLRLSTGQLRRVKAAASLYVNGAPRPVSYLLQPGDLVELTLSEPEPDYPAEAEPLAVLYEDAHLLAVDKPQGLIVHPTHSRLTGTLANRAWAHIRAGGGDGCHAVNRLDRDTGGIVLFAKNTWACSQMDGVVWDKRYLAVVWSGPAADEGAIDLPIRLEAPGGMRRICAPDGSPSRTEFRVLARRGELALLSLRLLTGRTHQIRVHCAASGFPVLGDRLYGSETALRSAAAREQAVQALWCVEMALRHPVSGETIRLSTQPDAKILRFFSKNS